MPRGRSVYLSSEVSPAFMEQICPCWKKIGCTVVFEAMPSQSCAPICRMEILKFLHIILKLKSTISGGNSVSVVLHADCAYFNVLVYIRRIFFKRLI